MQNSHTAFTALAILPAAAVLSALLIVALGPWLAQYALASSPMSIVSVAV